MTLPGRAGPYEIDALLGTGGTASVFHARHAETGQSAAIKLAHVGRWPIRSVQREIRVLEQLDHPGVVRLIEDGVLDGRPWVALEWLGDSSFDSDAPTVATTIADLFALPSDTSSVSRPRGPLPPVDEVRRRAGALAQTLAWLHGQGVAHCDLKPLNVLTRGDQPVLIDFGLWSHAHGSPPRFDQTEDERRALTRDVLLRPNVAGTLAYVAPETLRGRIVDARADLYAFGCILYELLTGAPPFTGAPSWLLQCHRTAVPTPVRDHRPEIPVEIDRLVQRLLEKDPLDRPGFAADVASELLGRTVPCEPFVYRPVRYLGPHRSWIKEPSTDGGIAVICGAEGSGRTRSALELAQSLRDRKMGVSVFACHEAMGPLEPFAAMLDGLPEADDRDSLLEAVHTALEQLHAEAPFTLILDDLHLADGLTSAFLHWVADREPSYRVVCTLKPESSPPAAEQLLEARVDRIDLEPLDARAIGQLAAQMLAEAGLPDPLAAALHERSGGNPLFVTEYLRTSVELGVLERTRGRWKLLQIEPSELPLPVSLWELLTRRHDALDEDARVVLDSLAVVGNGWHRHWTRELSGLSPERFDRALTELIRQRLVQASGPALGFLQHQVRQTAYDALHRDERRALHLRHAENVERGGTDRPELLALHYSRAGARSVAAVHLLAAAQRAARAYAREDAIRLYGWYIAQMDPEAPEAPEALFAMAQQCASAGRISEAIEPLDRAIRLCRLRANPLDGATLMGSQATTFMHLGDHDAARRLLTEARAIVERHGSYRERTVMEYRLWWLENNLGNYARSLEHLDAAYDLAVKGTDVLWPGRIRATRGQTQLYLGRRREAIAELEESMEALLAAGEQELHPVLGSLALARAEVGDREGARQAMDDAIANARSHEAWTPVLNLMSAEAYRRAALGEVDAARRLIAELEGLEHLDGAAIGHLARHAARARIAVEAGEPDQAVADLNAALAIQSETGIRAWADTLAHLELLVARRRGLDPGERLDIWRRSDRELPERRHPSFRAMFLCERVHIALDAGDDPDEHVASMLAVAKGYGATAETDTPLGHALSEVLARMGRPVS